MIRPTYSTTKMSLYTRQNIQIGDIHDYIQYAINARPMIAYIIRKNNWSYEQLQLINWDDLEAALKGYKPFYKTKIAQLMHDWQYIGERKHLFNKDTDKCPAKCGESETKQHYLVCKDKHMQLSRKPLLRAFHQRLSLLNTHPGIQTTLCKILTEGFQSEWWKNMQCTDTFDVMIKEATQKQSELGMMSVTKGYLIFEWKHIQQKWEKSSGTKRSKYQWGKEVVIATHTYVYDCWKVRNDIIHGKTEKSQKAIKKAELQNKVVQLYSKGRANLSLREKNYFNVPLGIRLKKGTESLSLWIQIVESIFRRKGAARQEKLDVWLEHVNPPEPDLAQPKAKHKQLGNNLDNSNTTYDDDGVEVSRS